MTFCPKIVLLYADTGGGHRSAAQAVRQAIRQLLGEGCELHLVNGTPFMPYPFNQAEAAYPVCVNRARLVYTMFWRATNNYWHTTAARHYIEWRGRPIAQAFLHQHPADVYISCHPIVNQVVPGLIKRHKPNVPITSVVSDLVTVHAGFWSPKIDHYCVPTEQARQRAIQNRISPHNITITGQPIAPDFARRVAQRRACRSSSDQERSRVLVMGGGDGMGRLTETVYALLRSDLPIRLVVVCGRNEQVRQTLLQAQEKTPNIPMEVLGFTEHVPELMGDADVLVTKAGPGSICEGFVAGLPILLYDAVPGQESGNISYVVQPGSGAWCQSPQQVVTQLGEWLSQPRLMQRLRQKSASLAQPDSAMRIANVVAQFVGDQAQHNSSSINLMFASPKHTRVTVRT